MITQKEVIEMKRDFALPESDVEFLDSLGLPWETIKDSGQHWLIIHDYSIPPGYNVERADIALRLEGYPVTQIDMAYFFPFLNRIDNKQINNLTPLTINDKQWQQWSRHRTGKNPWRVGIDDISTHLIMFDDCLSSEFTKR
jgi:hypothetical protein